LPICLTNVVLYSDGSCVCALAITRMSNGFDKGERELREVRTAVAQSRRRRPAPTI
jgi:hypothetical protein